MTQAGKTVIDQQERAEGGAPGDDLGAPFSFGPLRRAHLLITGQGPAVVLPDGSRAPSGGGSAGVSSLAGNTSRRQRQLVHRTELRQCAGGLGSSATNKRHGAYTCALLATTISPSNEACVLVTTDGCKKTTNRGFGGMMPYEEKCFNIVDSCSCNSWIFS
ncbi:hypothetical protein D7Y41_32920 [Anaerotruncus sp. 1XD22-93]|nr:hypothetical protein D7Y41_32920 [Anaerotruncus sp. 1XD22-93]